MSLSLLYVMQAAERDHMWVPYLESGDIVLTCWGATLRQLDHLEKALATSSQCRP